MLKWLQLKIKKNLYLHLYYQAVEEYIELLQETLILMIDCFISGLLLILEIWVITRSMIVGSVRGVYITSGRNIRWTIKYFLEFRWLK
jgi:hypothetical protein